MVNIACSSFVQLYIGSRVRFSVLKRFFITKLPPETFQNDNIKDLYLRKVVQISVREQFPLFTACGHFRLTM